MSRPHWNKNKKTTQKKKNNKKQNNKKTNQIIIGLFQPPNKKKLIRNKVENVSDLLTGPSEPIELLVYTYIHNFINEWKTNLIIID